MVFESFQIKGKGRGKKIGVPTINLQIPPNLKMEEGIYAVWVFIDGKNFKGALHFGPVPVFNELRRSLEVYLLDAQSIPETGDKNIIVRIVKKIRDIQNFPSPEAMVKQIDDDVAKIKKVLEKE